MPSAPKTQPLILPHPAPVTIRPAAIARDGRWVLRRALLGLGLLVAFTVAGAALYHTSIVPDAESVTVAE